MTSLTDCLPGGTSEIKSEEETVGKVSQDHHSCYDADYRTEFAYRCIRRYITHVTKQSTQFDPAV